MGSEDAEQPSRLRLEARGPMHTVYMGTTSFRSKKGKKKPLRDGRERAGQPVQYNTWRDGEKSNPKDHARILAETHCYPMPFLSISSPGISQCAVKEKIRRTTESTYSWPNMTLVYK